MPTEALPLASIRTDGGTQPRAELDQAVITEYVEALRDGARFPPVVVFYDGSDYWLADGFHRLHAAARAGRPHIAAEIRAGDQRAAILYAAGANAEHGLRRTAADKRQAVRTLLTDPEWSRWPQGKVAECCAVSREYVNRLSRELQRSCDRSQDGGRAVRRGAHTYTMRTEHIGRRPDAGPARAAHRPGVGAAPTEADPADDVAAAVGPALFPEDRAADPRPAAAAGPDPDDPAGALAGATPGQWDAVGVVIGAVTVHCADARGLAAYLPDGSVDLTLTSPPYNVDISYNVYNDALPRAEHEALLGEVFRECYRVTAPGGRIAVIVPFGVGRNPWTPVAARVLALLEEAGYTLRGQIIWHKGVCGNRTTWGSFRLPTDPSLRDTAEAILVAHKGPSRLAVPPEVIQHDDKGSFSPWLAGAEEFMALAQDYWAVTPESASRVGHPAPFPVALAERLLRFYAYPRAHVLDPFAGSGTVGVAALRLGCRATLFDIDPSYCELAAARCRDELSEQ